MPFGTQTESIEGEGSASGSKWVPKSGIGMSVNAAGVCRFPFVSFQFLSSLKGNFLFRL